MSCMADPGGEEKPTVTYSSISDTSSAHFVSQLQTFEPYNTAPGNEILGFSSKLVASSSEQFYDEATNDNVMIFPDSNRLLAKSSSFPHNQGCHGLSLSLNSSDPVVWRFGHNNPNEQVSGMQLGHFPVRNSKFSGPAKELLAEFCSVDQIDDNTAKGKAVKNSEWIDSDELVKKQSLYAFSLLELHQRKAKLIQMLEEVHRRYKHYCSQMKALVQTFEAVAGNGAAEAYSGMASRAMSRHFRCLKDAIVAQIKATKRVIGEKDSSGAAPGTTKGETPRLRILDQTLRQQRAYQHMNMMESHPWRPQRGLPERAVSVLRAWLFEHFLHPYPSDVDKTILARQTGLSRSQVSNWFINARVRLWKPMVEEMYLEDLKENPPTPTPIGAPDRDAPDLHHNNPNQKPAHVPTTRVESGSLSSVVNNNSVVKSEEKEPNNKYHHPNGFTTVADAYGAVMQFDFSSYNNHHPTAAGNTSTTLYGGGRGVSLTLGLHGGGGFSPASQSSLFLSREEMGECGTELYSSSLLDGENQGLVQYRNLMGAQFLHDLAG